MVAVAVGMLRNVDRPDRAEAITAWALGLALRHQRRLGEASGWLEFAVKGLPVSSDDHTSASLSLAGVRIYEGDFDGAQQVLDSTHAAPTLAPRVDFQRAGIAVRRGDLDAPWDGFTRALGGFDQLEDRLGQAHAHSEMGQVLVARDQALRALPRFGLAQAIYAALGLDMLAALARHNLGYAATRAGYLAFAADTLDQAHRELRDLGEPFAETALDRAEALLLLGAHRRAVKVVHNGLQRLDAGAVDVDRAEMLVGLAAALSARGADELADQALDVAERLFTEQGREAWTEVVSLHRLRRSPDAKADTAMALAEGLHQRGFVALGAEADLLSLELAARAGQPLNGRPLARLAALPQDDQRHQTAVQLAAAADGDHVSVIDLGLRLLGSLEADPGGRHRLAARAQRLHRHRRVVPMVIDAATAINDPASRP